MWQSIWTSVCVYTNAFLHKRNYTEIHSLRILLKVWVCLFVFVCVCTIHTYRPKICRFLYRGMFFSPHTAGKPAGYWGDWLIDKYVCQSPVKKTANPLSFEQREFNVGNWLQCWKDWERQKRKWGNPEVDDGRSNYSRERNKKGGLALRLGRSARLIVEQGYWEKGLVSGKLLHSAFSILLAYKPARLSYENRKSLFEGSLRNGVSQTLVPVSERKRIDVEQRNSK